MSTLPTPPDRTRRFGGVERLYGAGVLDRFANTSVCVIGIGGVGSWAVEALARSGVGSITLIDLDHVAESNINRQIHASDDTLGQAKVAAMSARIAAINPQCQVMSVDAFITPDDIAGLVPRCDAIIDAIDQTRAKAALIAHCRQHQQRLVTVGAAGGRQDPLRLRCDDLSRTQGDALAARVRARLRRDYGFPRNPQKKFGVDCVYSVEPPVPVHAQGSCSPAGQGLHCAGWGSSVCVTAAFGFAAAAQVLRAMAQP
jgi:tRNA A37 threonylcarbamoyladenosine dehydratase